jgi:hypothetical protein
MPFVPHLQGQGTELGGSTEAGGALDVVPADAEVAELRHAGGQLTHGIITILQMRQYRSCREQQAVQVAVLQLLNFSTQDATAAGSAPTNKP